MQLATIDIHKNYVETLVIRAFYILEQATKENDDNVTLESIEAAKVILEMFKDYLKIVG